MGTRLTKTNHNQKRIAMNRMPFYVLVGCVCWLSTDFVCLQISQTIEHQDNTKYALVHPLPETTVLLASRANRDNINRKPQTVRSLAFKDESEAANSCWQQYGKHCDLVFRRDYTLFDDPLLTGDPTMTGDIDDTTALAKREPSLCERISNQIATIPGFEIQTFEPIVDGRSEFERLETSTPTRPSTALAKKPREWPAMDPRVPGIY